MSRGIHWLLYQWNWAGKECNATETFSANHDDVSLWELAGRLLVWTFRGRF